MPFSQMGDFTHKPTDLQDRPTQNTASTVKQYLQQPADDLKAFLNNIHIKEDQTISDKVDAIIAGTGASDSVEVSAAHYDNIIHTTYKNLGERLDVHSAQLAENANLRPSMIPSTLAKLEAGEDVMILVAGDSVVQGGHFGATWDQTFTAYLAAKIAAKYPNSKVIRIDGNATTGDMPIPSWTENVIQAGTNGQTIRVVKSGSGGDTILRLYRRMNDIVQYSGITPNLIITSVGINDSLDADAKKYAPPDRYEAGYRTYNEYLKRFANSELVILTPHWHGDSPDAQLNNLDDYIAACKRVANAEKVQLIDIHQIWVDHYSATAANHGQGTWMDASDTIHPTLYGHSAIADKIYNDLFIENQEIRPNKTELLPVIKYTSNLVTYTGTWSEHVINASSNTTYKLKYSSTAGNTITLKVTGRNLYLLTRRGRGLGTCTVQVDSNAIQTINLNSNYPADVTDVGHDSICSYFYEKIPIGVNLTDAEHTITITVASGYTYFFGIAYESYLQDDKPVFNSGKVTGQGTGTTSIHVDITFAKPHKTVPIVTATSDSVGYTTAVINESTTSCTLYVGRANGGTFSTSDTAVIKWQSIDSMQ